MCCTQQATMVSSLDEPQLSKLAEGPVKVLVADDTLVMRRAICGFLRNRLEIEIVVGEAADYAQTVQMANDFRPEIILMDLHLACRPDITPLEVRTNLNHGSRLVAVSIAIDEEAKALAKSLGAVRLLDKTKLFEELIPTILAVR
jgi:two-component system, NarL family, response regulator LiaR